MNLRRGAFRLWLAASAAWIFFTLWSSDVACPLRGIGLPVPTGPWCDFQNAEPSAYYSGAAWRAVLPPIMIGVLAAVALWVVSGFTSSRVDRG